MSIFQTEEFGRFLTIVLTIAISVFVPFFLTLAVSVYNKLIAYMKTAMDQKTFEYINSVVSVLVMAAEQSGLKEMLLATGADKKAYVMSEAQRILSQAGIKVSVDDLDRAIEGAVYQHINAAKK